MQTRLGRYAVSMVALIAVLWVTPTVASARFACSACSESRLSCSPSNSGGAMCSFHNWLCKEEGSCGTQLVDAGEIVPGVERLEIVSHSGVRIYERTLSSMALKMVACDGSTRRSESLGLKDALEVDDKLSSRPWRQPTLSSHRILSGR